MVSVFWSRLVKLAAGLGISVHLQQTWIQTGSAIALSLNSLRCCNPDQNSSWGICELLGCQV